MSDSSSPRSNRGNAALWGLVLIAAGGYFLLRSFGIALPGIGQLWPAFPVLVGLGFVVEWLFHPNKRAAHGIMIPATINLLIGLLFFGFTLGYLRWSDMAYLWPVFPLIVGIAFCVAWVFSLFRNWGLLIPGGITGAVGVIGLSYTIGAWTNRYIPWVRNGWPVLLIGIGLAVLISGLRGRKPSPDADWESIPEQETVQKVFKSPSTDDET